MLKEQTFNRPQPYYNNEPSNSETNNNLPQHQNKHFSIKKKKPKKPKQTNQKGQKYTYEC